MRAHDSDIKIDLCQPRVVSIVCTPALCQIQIWLPNNRWWWTISINSYAPPRCVGFDDDSDTIVDDGRYRETDMPPHVVSDSTMALARWLMMDVVFNNGYCVSDSTMALTRWLMMDVVFNNGSWTIVDDGRWIQWWLSHDDGWWWQYQQRQRWKRGRLRYSYAPPRWMTRRCALGLWWGILWWPSHDGVCDVRSKY